MLFQQPEILEIKNVKEIMDSLIFCSSSNTNSTLEISNAIFPEENTEYVYSFEFCLRILNHLTTINFSSIYKQKKIDCTFENPTLQAMGNSFKYLSLLKSLRLTSKLYLLLDDKISYSGIKRILPKLKEIPQLFVLDLSCMFTLYIVNNIDDSGIVKLSEEFSCLQNLNELNLSCK